MKRIPAYLTDEEIARKIQIACQEPKEMIVNSIKEKSARIISHRVL